MDQQPRSPWSDTPPDNLESSTNAFKEAQLVLMKTAAAREHRHSAVINPSRRILIVCSQNMIKQGKGSGCEHTSYCGRPWRAATPGLPGRSSGNAGVTVSLHSSQVSVWHFQEALPQEFRRIRGRPLNRQKKKKMLHLSSCHLGHNGIKLFVSDFAAFSRHITLTPLLTFSSAWNPGDFMVGIYLTQTLFTTPRITRPQTDSFSWCCFFTVFSTGPLRHCCCTCSQPSHLR